MSTAIESLPLTETVAPADAPGVVDAVREAFAAGTAIYPLGGGTSLDYGLPARRTGIGLALGRLDRVIDYPARDMTITVEAGITIAALQRTLAEEGQQLPIDAPRASRATLGGVIACNTSGPRRLAHGTIRDYVIGISAVDGRGAPFKGGGRVVKNVAGYDFCKLLCGSLGTLGVITQVTLKVKPLAEKTALIACAVADLPQAESLLAGLIRCPVTPSAIELLVGPAWQGDPALPRSGDAAAWLVVGLEGTRPEVAWMSDALLVHWRASGLQPAPLDRESAGALWSRLVEFPQAEPAPMVLKLVVRSSRLIELVGLVRELDPEASLACQAGNGVATARMARLPQAGLSRWLVGRLQPAAQQAGGHVVVLSAEGSAELTRQAVWGAAGEAVMLMEAVKQQFDPKNVLNPGRFVYPG